MDQVQLDSLDRLVHSRNGSVKDIKELQTLLKAEGRYTGAIDGDAGAQTAAGLMETFRQHPALLNNAAPWLIKTMEDQGFGKQLRELVAANPTLRANLVASAVELIDRSPRAHTEQQTQLSLLGLYNYSGGIDGRKGSEHIQAIKDLNILSSSLKGGTPSAPPPVDSSLAGLPSTRRGTEMRYPPMPPIAPPARESTATTGNPPAAPKTVTATPTTAAAIPPARASSAPPIAPPARESTATTGKPLTATPTTATVTPTPVAAIPPTRASSAPPIAPPARESTATTGKPLTATPTTAAVAQPPASTTPPVTRAIPPAAPASSTHVAIPGLTGAGDGTSFGELSRPADTNVARFMDVLNTPAARNDLAALFTRSARNPNASPLSVSGLTVTPEQQKQMLAEFLGNSHRGQGLAIVRLIGAESDGGDYNIAFGGKRHDFTSMTIDQVIEWQRKHINDGGTSSAVGYYQFMRETLVGLKSDLKLKGDEPFNQDMQDTLGLALLARRGYIRWLESDGSPREEGRIMRQLAGEWAALPKDSSGAGMHDKVWPNKAFVKPADVLAALRAEREAYQEYKKTGIAMSNQDHQFDNLAEVSDTMARPKPKARRSRDDRAEGLPTAQDPLAPTPVLAMNEEFSAAHGTPPTPPKPGEDSAAAPATEIKRGGPVLA